MLILQNLTLLFILYEKIYFLLFCAAMTACARDGDILPPFNPGDLHGGSQVVSIPKTVLGDKLENPYSVSNMRLALESPSPRSRRIERRRHLNVASVREVQTEKRRGARPVENGLDADVIRLSARLRNSRAGRVLS